VIGWHTALSIHRDCELNNGTTTDMAMVARIEV
jgi:hypothetical protein